MRVEISQWRVSWSESPVKSRLISASLYWSLRNYADLHFIPASLYRSQQDYKSLLIPESPIESYLIPASLYKSLLIAAGLHWFLSNPSKSLPIRGRLQVSPDLSKSQPTPTRLQRSRLSSLIPVVYLHCPLSYLTIVASYPSFILLCCVLQELTAIKLRL